MPHQNLIGTYLHTQDVVASTWVIQHNLTQSAPVVDCWVMHNGEKTNIMPISVTATTSSIVTVVFSTARTGFASVV